MVGVTGFEPATPTSRTLMEKAPILCDINKVGHLIEGLIRRYITLPAEPQRQALRLTNSHTLEITTDPSATEDANRLTEPARTSPTAKMPGSEVAKGEDADPSPEPVITKPLSSSSTRPESHSVLGAAPTMMNSARVSTRRVAPVFTLRMVSASRCPAPCNALTSAPYSIVILGSAASRLER